MLRWIVWLIWKVVLLGKIWKMTVNTVIMEKLAISIVQLGNVLNADFHFFSVLWFCIFSYLLFLRFD